MYVLIDRQQMAITHKHHDRTVLNKLSWIECTNSAAVLALTNTRALMEFTASELKLIYKNATGAELTGYAQGLATAVLEMSKRLPITDAVLAEVEAQALFITDGDKSQYSYCKGAKRPTEHPSLFLAPLLTAPRMEAEELGAANGCSASAFPPTAHQNSGARTNGTPSAPRAPSAPRTGGTRDTIFRVADEMWAAKGSPTNISVVLALRKEIMQELEVSHGVKKSTSSTALGDWQKAKAQN